jgi:hypothetical protein
MLSNIIALLAATALCAPALPGLNLSDESLLSDPDQIPQEPVDVLANAEDGEYELTLLNNPIICDVQVEACPIPAQPTACAVQPHGRKSCLRRYFESNQVSQVKQRKY